MMLASRQLIKSGSSKLGCGRRRPICLGPATGLTNTFRSVGPPACRWFSVVLQPDATTVKPLSSLPVRQNDVLSEDKIVPFTVITYCRVDIPMNVAMHETSTPALNDLAIDMATNPCHRLIPLTISDVHLRDEQLPFCYFFQERLDPNVLQASLQRVLQHFPVVGGHIQDNFQAIRCSPDDTVPLAFGEINTTLEQWLSETRGHVHQAGGGHARLLPIFDPLLQNSDDNQLGSMAQKKLASFRVTYFQCGGTAIGVNFLHALGDTASCVRFVHCWGREAQDLAYPQGACNQRANATVMGMMSEEAADLMGLSATAITRPSTGEASDTLMSAFSQWCNSMFAVASHDNQHKEKTLKSRDFDEAKEAQHKESQGHHEYISLHFPPNVLQAMKEVGMNSTKSSIEKDRFVSTNDMVTAFGWLLKRSLSRDYSWNISIVVNLRGRFGISAFTDMDYPNADTGTAPNAESLDKESDDSHPPKVEGLFGNGITNVVACYPSTDDAFGVLDVSKAAKSIRKCLQKSLLEMPERVQSSRMGRVMAAPISTVSTFPTTSWGQFPISDIAFSPTASLKAFHGHPSHPLPFGRGTYSSVIMRSIFPSLVGSEGESQTSSELEGPSRKYGLLYKLLLPSYQAEDAKLKHQELCEAFLAEASALRELPNQYNQKCICTKSP